MIHTEAFNSLSERLQLGKVSMDWIKLSSPVLRNWDTGRDELAKPSACILALRSVESFGNTGNPSTIFSRHIGIHGIFPDNILLFHSDNSMVFLLVVKKLE
jgi:hypothetical protein